MKTLWKIIARHPFLLVSMVLFILLILQRECAHQPPCPGSDTLTTVSATTDTLIITHNHYLPPPPPDTVIHTDTVFPDTASILADYSALRIYNRTLLDDSSGKVSLTDSIQFNSLQGSQFSATLFQKYTVETITHTVYQPEPQKFKVFAGISVGVSYPLTYRKPILAPQVSFLNRKDVFFTLSINPFNRYLLLGTMMKLHLGH